MVDSDSMVVMAKAMVMVMEPMVPMVTNAVVMVMVGSVVSSVTCSAMATSSRHPVQGN